MTIPQPESLGTLPMENLISQTSKSCYYESAESRLCPDVSFHRGYSETGHLTHSVTSTTAVLSFLAGLPRSHSEMCCLHHPEKKKKKEKEKKRRKIDHKLSLLCFNFHWLPIPQRIQYKINTFRYKCIRRALLGLISVTVFNFTHPPVLSALLLILSASRFLVADFPQLVLAPFLSSVPLHGMTFPFLSDRNPLWTL